MKVSTRVYERECGLINSEHYCEESFDSAELGEIVDACRLMRDFISINNLGKKFDEFVDGLPTEDPEFCQDFCQDCGMDVDECACPNKFNEDDSRLTDR